MLAGYCSDAAAQPHNGRLLLMNELMFALCAKRESPSRHLTVRKLFISRESIFLVTQIHLFVS